MEHAKLARACGASHLAYASPSGATRRVVSLARLGCGGRAQLCRAGRVGSVMSYTKITPRRSVPRNKHSLFVGELLVPCCSEPWGASGLQERQQQGNVCESYVVQWVVLMKLKCLAAGCCCW